MKTAKRILKQAAAEDKGPFEGLLNYRNSPFEDIGVTSAQLLMRSTNTNMIPTHQCLLFTSAGGS